MSLWVNFQDLFYFVTNYLRTFKFTDTDQLDLYGTGSATGNRKLEEVWFCSIVLLHGEKAATPENITFDWNLQLMLAPCSDFTFDLLVSFTHLFSFVRSRDSRDFHTDVRRNPHLVSVNHSSSLSPHPWNLRHWRPSVSFGSFLWLRLPSWPLWRGRDV